MQSKLFHHTDANLPSIPIVPPSSPYLAAKALYHKKPFFPLNLQHQLPSNDILNSLILLTPILLFETYSVPIYPIYFPRVLTSQKKKKKSENRFKGSNDTWKSLEEGKEVNQERRQNILQKDSHLRYEKEFRI